MSMQYKNLAEYLGDNRLVINNDKTHLLVKGSRKNEQARARVHINTGTVVVSPVETEKLLGINIHQSVKCKSMLSTTTSPSSPCSLCSIAGYHLCKKSPEMQAT